MLRVADHEKCQRHRRATTIRQKGTIRMSYVDLHLHLLPGVDDGPADEEAGLDHARRLVRDCVREAVVTPHAGHPAFPLDVASIAARAERLRAALDAARIPLLLHPGAELHASAAAAIGHASRLAPQRPWAPAHAGRVAATRRARQRLVR
jgi:hypothetical protein